MRAVLAVLKRHPVLSLVFVLAVGLSVLFAVRMTVSAIVWSDPARIEQPPAAWMTPRYVARSWDLDPEDVARAVGIGPEGTWRAVTLEEVAEAQGRSVAAVLDDLRVFLDERRGRR